MGGILTWIFQNDKMKRQNQGKNNLKVPYLMFLQLSPFKLPSTVISNNERLEALQLLHQIQQEKEQLRKNINDSFGKVKNYNEMIEELIVAMWSKRERNNINSKFLVLNKPISSIVLPPRKILNATLSARTTPIPSTIRNITLDWQAKINIYWG